MTPFSMMDYGEAITEFEEFFSEQMYKQVSNAVQSGKDSIVVDFSKMDAFNFELSDQHA